MTARLRLSPSQISAFRACEVRWRLHWLDGVPEPTTPALADGTATHAAVEYRLGHAPAAGFEDRHLRLADALIGAARTAGVPLDDGMIEVAISWQPDLADVTVTGRIDVVFPGGVVDWKTRRSLRWAPSADKLEADPQAIVYVSAYVQSGGALPATFAHVNVTTHGPVETSVVAVTFDRDKLEAGQRGLLPVMRRMLEVAAEPDQAKPNYSSCSAYGGCPHRDRCAMRPTWPHQEVVVTSTLEDRLAARRGSINPPDQPAGLPAAAPPPAPTQGDLLAAAASAPPVAKRRAGTVAAVNDALSQPAPCVPTAQAPRMLLLGCAPLVGIDGAVFAERWLAPIAAAVAERNGVPHYGMIEFGRGKSELVGTVAELVRRGEVPPILVLDRRSPVCEAVVDVLLSAYPVVLSRLG